MGIFASEQSTLYTHTLQQILMFVVFAKLFMRLYVYIIYMYICMIFVKKKTNFFQRLHKFWLLCCFLFWILYMCMHVCMHVRERVQQFLVKVKGKQETYVFHLHQGNFFLIILPYCSLCCFFFFILKTWNLFVEYNWNENFYIFVIP